MIVSAWRRRVARSASDRSIGSPGMAGAAYVFPDPGPTPYPLSGEADGNATLHHLGELDGPGGPDREGDDEARGPGEGPRVEDGREARRVLDDGRVRLRRVRGGAERRDVHAARLRDRERREHPHDDPESVDAGRDREGGLETLGPIRSAKAGAMRKPSSVSIPKRERAHRFDISGPPVTYKSASPSKMEGPNTQQI